jgi:copper ion binding protein
MSTEQVYRVPGMSCEHCVAAIESAVSEVPGVSSVHADLAVLTVRVGGPAEISAVRAAIEGAGYDVAETPPEG